QQRIAAMVTDLARQYGVGRASPPAARRPAGRPAGPGRPGRPSGPGGPQPGRQAANAAGGSGRADGGQLSLLWSPGTAGRGARRHLPAGLQRADPVQPAAGAGQHLLDRAAAWRRAHQSRTALSTVTRTRPVLVISYLRIAESGGEYAWMLTAGPAETFRTSC